MWEHLLESGPREVVNLENEHMAIMSLILNSDGSLFSIGASGQLSLWNINRRQLIKDFGIVMGVMSTACNTERGLFLGGEGHKNLQLWN